MEFEYKKIKADFKFQYSLNIKKSLTLSLLFFLIVIHLSPDVELAPQEKGSPTVLIHVEDIPMTRQAYRPPPPPKPAIPIPSDDESIPEEETIEETTLKYTIFEAEATPIPGITLTPPKPIAWVFPEFPEEEKKKGVSGVVKLSLHINEKGKVINVIVMDNTTGSEKCAQAAIEAAYGSRFFPAEEGNKPVDYWISQPYRFDVKE